MFIAHVKQTREGCDYTIGCGQALWELIAKTREEAVKELKEKVIGEWEPEYNEFEGGCWDEWGEGDLGKVELIEVVKMENLPVELWYSEAKECATKEKAQAVQQAEKEQYEILKAKYDS